MTTKPDSKDEERYPQEHQQAKLERAFLEEFLAPRGYHLKDIHLLPGDVAKKLMIEASIYASNKLAEIETRSTLINELHGNL